ncbi:MAG: phosphatase PAP2 family protein [Candidatus Blackburnbacteria bacterium]|nr:phosphatase PAP2 family protein [Candidatus Blackburnbacteria bacterium]
MDALLVTFAKHSYILSVVLGLVILVLSTQRKKLAVLTIASLPLSLIISRIASKFIIDPRPFVVNNTTPLIPHAPDNGFPSDHTLLVATIAAIIFIYNKKWGMVLAFLAFLVGASRVYAQVHHWLDIGGSFIVALTAVYLARILVEWANVRFNLKTPQ